MTTRQQTSELSRGLRRRRVRRRAEHQPGEHLDVTEYRGPESYEQQIPAGRGGQSGIFDQHDYPPRESIPGEPPKENDGHLAPPEDLAAQPAKPA